MAGPALHFARPVAQPPVAQPQAAPRLKCSFCRITLPAGQTVPACKRHEKAWAEWLAAQAVAPTREGS